MEKLQWFKFNPSEWTMGRIMRCTPTAQASFMRLMCRYWNDNCTMTIEEAVLEFTEKDWSNMLKLKIIKLQDNQEFISITFLDNQREDIYKISKQASIAGKASAEKRKANVQQKSNDRSTTVQQIPTEKNREEKNIDSIYRQFNHLWITKDEVEQLKETWNIGTIDHVLDSIENYRHKEHYTSLFLTAKTWLKDKPTKTQEIATNKESSEDKAYLNIQNKLKGISK